MTSAGACRILFCALAALWLPACATVPYEFVLDIEGLETLLLQTHEAQIERRQRR